MDDIKSGIRWLATMSVMVGILMVAKILMVEFQTIEFLKSLPKPYYYFMGIIGTMTILIGWLAVQLSAQARWNRENFERRYRASTWDFH